MRHESFSVPVLLVPGLTCTARLQSLHYLTRVRVLTLWSRPSVAECSCGWRVKAGSTRYPSRHFRSTYIPTGTLTEGSSAGYR
jgi:hypothetical protein